MKNQTNPKADKSATFLRKTLKIIYPSAHNARKGRKQSRAKNPLKKRLWIHGIYFVTVFSIGGNRR
jgi:hypothetical protein